MKIIKIKPLLVLSLFLSLTSFSMDDTDENITIPDTRVGLETDDAIREFVRKRQNEGAWKELRTTAGTTALFGMGSAATFYFTPGLGTAVGMGALYMLKDQMANIAAYYGLYPPEQNMVIATKLNKREEEFELKRSSFLEFNRSAGEGFINKARDKIGYGLKKSYDHDIEQTNSAIAKLDILLEMPDKLSKPRPLHDVLADIKIHLRTYDPQVADDVLVAVTNLHSLREGQENKNKKGGKRSSYKSSYLFIGEAGVGKTETAQMIAKVLNRPFCKFNMGSMKVSDFQGKAPKEAWGGKIGTIGAFVRCFTRPDIGEKALDPVIFIDEIHDILNSPKNIDRDKFYSFLKIISEANETTLEDFGVGLKVDFSSATFIFAMNGSLSDSKDTAGALASRLETIEFYNLTQDQKNYIADATFLDLCAVHNWQPKPSDQKFVEEIVRRDASSGARVLKNVVNEYIVFQKTCANTKLSCREFDVKRSIKKHGGNVAEK